MQYDIRGPQGNIFCVLGMLKNVEKQFRKEGCTETADACVVILKNAMNMKYDQILDQIEKATYGSVEFIGRNNNDDNNEDDGEVSEDFNEMY